MGKDETDYNSEGEKDYGARKYNKPHGVVDLLIGLDVDKSIEENKQYDSGWENAKKQSRK